MAISTTENELKEKLAVHLLKEVLSMFVSILNKEKSNGRLMVQLCIHMCMRKLKIGESNGYRMCGLFKIKIVFRLFNDYWRKYVDMKN